jgi:hypothetical protein
MNSNVKIVNKPARMYRNSFIVCALLIMIVVIIWNSSIDGKGGKYALVFILGFAALSALITALMFIPRAREFDRLVSELKPLAHWKYTLKEWESFLKESKKEMLTVNKATLRWASGIAGVVGLILLIASHDSLFLVIIGGIILMMASAAFLGPLIQTALMRNEGREAYIGNGSAYIGGSFYIWTQAGAKLTGAGIYTEDTPIPMLHIIYEFPTIRAFQQEIIRIPVPGGKMTEAEKVVEELLKQA